MTLLSENKLSLTLVAATHAVGFTGTITVHNVHTSKPPQLKIDWLAGIWSIHNTGVYDDVYSIPPRLHDNVRQRGLDYLIYVNDDFELTRIVFSIAIFVTRLKLSINGLKPSYLCAFEDWEKKHQ